VPTYQYACTDPACDHRFEQFQSFTDAALTDCPICSSRLRKVYGSVGVVFKGSGFYRNDSRAESNGAKKKTSDSDAKSSADSSSSNSSESSDSSKSSDPKSGKDSTSSSQSSDGSTTSKSKDAAPAKSSSSSGSSSGTSKS